jgi:hypothetical protein
MADDSSLDKLQKGLDSRTAHLAPLQRRRLHDKRMDVPNAWQAPPPQTGPAKPKRNFVITVFVAAVLFFVIAVSASVFFFLRGGQVVSSNNIRVELLGPTNIGGGEELVLQIALTNANPVPIRSSDLIVEFPEGTRDAANLSADLPRLRMTIGDLESGETVNKTVRAVLFGEEGAQQNINVKLVYGIDASNAVFTKEHDYSVSLNASPVSLEVGAPLEAISGQEVSFGIQLVSNSSSPLQNLVLQAVYPFGFQFIESTLQPRTNDNTLWDIGDLPPGGKKTITIRGTLTGQDGDERFFRFSTGTLDDANSKNLAIVYVVKPVSLTLQRPFLGAELTFDGEPLETAVVRAGKTVRADINWVNNLPSTVLDGEITVKLTGTAFDRSSVTVEGGHFRSGDDTIVWDGRTLNALKSISAGQKGRLQFTFNTLGLASGQSFKNPQITMDVSVSGRRVNEANVPEAVRSSSQHVVKVATDMLLASRLTRIAGPFTNTGPIPPKADVETTYTVTWNVTNSSNTVDDVRVMASLPTYVRYVGTVSPQSESLTFNSIGGTVVWDIGTLEPTAPGSVGREVSFQIALTPSITQVGDTLILLNEQSVTGTDRFTNVPVGSNRPALNSRLSSEPQFRTSDGVVVQ